MLPAAHRLRTPGDFRRVLRSGVRAGRKTLVIHAVGAAPSGDETAPRVGFVVSKQVGGAVVRNRVKRRLRHLAGAELGAVPPGSEWVVRALPPAATAATLPEDFRGAWDQASGKLRARAT